VVLAIFLWAFLLIQEHPSEALSVAVQSVASGLILITARAGIPWRGRIARAVAYTGLVSYGLYLWHWILLMVLERQAGPIFINLSHMGWFLAIGLTLALSLPPAAASWYAIERPAMRFAQRFYRRTKTDAPVPSRSAVRS
jgi:peptidoglycan/LPS O-acetylase OafA/YrhL